VRTARLSIFGRVGEYRYSGKTLCGWPREVWARTSTGAGWEWCPCPNVNVAIRIAALIKTQTPTLKP
jgi:hypothetical protein